MTIIPTAEAKVSHLESVIASALAAMDDGRYGDARLILKTGKSSPLKPVTSVLEKRR